MQTEQVQVVSDGIKIDAAYFWDDHALRADAPLVIVCSGFTGLKNIHPERFARALTPYGYFCFGFDYRGFADSGGTREKVLIEEQVRDIANVVAVVAERARTEGRKLVLAGWGMGGGLVLDAYRQAEGLIDGLIAMNGFFDAVRVQKALRGGEGWKAFRDFMNAERLRLAKGGDAKGIDPFAIYPLDEKSRVYVDTVLRKNPDYGVTSDFEFADSLIAFTPEAHIDERFAGTPLLIAHGAENNLHPVEEARSLFARYPGPKSLFLLPDAGHTEWMLDEDPKFQVFSARIAQWLDEHFA